MQAARVHQRLCLAAFGLAAAAQGQIAGWETRVSNVVTPDQPSATVEVWAWMDAQGGPSIAFARGNYDLVAGDGLFSGPRWMQARGLLGGVEGNRVVGVLGRDTWFPKVPTLLNPYPLWKVTGATEDFTPRRVPLDTLNCTIFDVSFEPTWIPRTIFPNYVPGHAEIQVDLGLVCYADCDTSTGVGVLDLFDFLCFQDRFAVNAMYACGCDTSTGSGVCDIFDFLCFQNEFVAGCP